MIGVWFHEVFQSGVLARLQHQFRHFQRCLGPCYLWPSWFIYGCFGKWWYPQIIHGLIGFSIVNHPFWGYPYFWKHPYTFMKFWNLNWCEVAPLLDHGFIRWQKTTLWRRTGILGKSWHTIPSSEESAHVSSWEQDEVSSFSATRSEILALWWLT